MREPQSELKGFVAGAVWVVCTALVPGVVDAQGPAGGVVEGVVIARETRQVIPNAKVSIDSLSATANTGGRFRLTGVPPGNAIVVATAPGYLDLRIEAVQVRADQPTTLSVEMEATPNYLERVQVTASKTPLSIGEVAAQTDVINRDMLETRGDQTLTDALNHVPGAVVSTQLGIFDSVMLRGMPRGDPEFTNVLVLVDGVPQTLSNNASRIIALPINDAGSVEVVRGPNSALYGRTAIGGAVNIRTEDPAATPEARVEFTGGQFGTLKGLAAVTGPVSNWGGFYVSAAKEHNSGYFVNKTTTDFNDGNWALFGKLTFTGGTKSYGSVTVNRVVSDNSTPTNEPIINGQFLHVIDPRFDRFTNFNIPGVNYHQGETRLTLNYNRQLGANARIVEVLGYRKVQHAFQEDGDFIGSPYDLAAHTVTMYPFSQQMDEDILYEELRFEATPTIGSMKSTFIAGGSYDWNSGKLASDFIFNDPDLFGFSINYLNPVIPPRSEWEHDTGSRVYHLGITGLFAQYSLVPVSRLLLTAGGRYDRLDLDNARNGGAKIEDTFDAFSPKASATVRLLGADGANASTLSAYGAYSQAFLPPRRPSSLVPADVPLNLKPENIDNIEGGLKGSLANGRVSLEATYFRMREDGVVLSTRQGPFFLPTNAGKVRYKGVETGVTLQPAPQVSLYANASFYRNRFGEFVIESEDGDDVLTGNRLPISPDHVYNGGVSIRPIPAFDVTLNIKHVGTVETDNSNTFELPSYSLLDAAATWRRGPLRFTLSAHNLTNKEYYWTGGETADPGRPRQILLTTSVVFK